MGKKKNKNKKKRVNPKKERYAKFKREKPSNLSFAPVSFTPEQQRERQEDEKRIDMFLRYNRNPPAKEVRERKARSKR